MRTKWVMGNWKMNGSLSQNAQLLTQLTQNAAVQNAVVFVPAPYLQQAQTLLQGSDVLLGAQNVSQFANGAYTGEVSLSMLKEFGVSMILVGHSERRQLFGESNQVIAQKTLAVLQAGLTPVVCVGETLAEREVGQAKEVVLSQLIAVADTVADGLGQCVVAYEPVWAIGTGKTASPEQAQEVHAWLRDCLTERGAPSVSVLYGGSVKASNAKELFEQPDIDGGLVGGASLIAEEFIGICQSAV